ncbi:hypothetical protein [Chthonobacter albigriseus]|uniref:hypothetical protein n=1 Tax=Chthonobacter albigriseus TaxID=1683161 RepID=UPI0015EF5A7D|nr:hypothetical protein [Chthonobacter albigriseus]
MAVTTSYADDDPALYQVRRKPVRRASTISWVLKITTICIALAGTLVLTDLVLNWTSLIHGRDGRTGDPSPVTVFVADQRLTIPGNMFRFQNQRAVGQHERIDLAIHWPSLEGFSEARRESFLDPTQNAPVVFLTIRPRETATDSAGRLANVYQHFFDETALEAPPGLIGRRLSEDSGLPGEEVFFEAGSTDPFTTHCLADDGSGYPAPCLTEIHAGESLSVQVRFRKGLLGEWQGIKKASKALLLSFGLFS